MGTDYASPGEDRVCPPQESPRLQRATTGPLGSPRPTADAPAARPPADSRQPTDLSIPHFFRRCLLENLSGTLRVSACLPTPALETVTIDRGAVRFASSSVGAKCAVERAIEAGTITRDEFDGLGHDGQLAFKVAEAVADLFALAEPRTRFEPGNVLDPYGTVAVPLEAAIVLGVLRIDDAERVEELFGDPEQTLAPSAKLGDALRAAPLRPEARRFVESLSGPATAAAMVAGASLDRGAAARLVAGLKLAALLEPAALVEPTAPQPAPVHEEETPARARRAVSRPVVPLPAPTVTTAPPPLGREEAERVVARVRQKLAALRARADFYTLLEVESTARADEIKAKYVELVKTFHPNRHAQLAVVDPNVKHDLEIVFAALASAFDTLSKATSRAAYNAMRLKRDAAPAPTSAASAGSSTAATAPPVASAAPAPAARAVPLTAAQWYSRGIEYAQGEDHNRAAHAFMRATELAPNDAEAHVALARSLERLDPSGRQAEKEMLKAVDLAPESADVLRELGKLYRRLGRVEEGRAVFERARSFAGRAA